MHPFDFTQAEKIPDAIRSGSRGQTKFVAGGTTLIDLMKCDVESPAHVVDINALTLGNVQEMRGGIRIGALARTADVAAAKLVIAHAPVISQALLASASPQIRNAASIGGNLMQRTRCPGDRKRCVSRDRKAHPRFSDHDREVDVVRRWH